MISGIDETEADDVPQPINDAPIAREGPLPKDFQEALEILFDGDKPKPADVIANETKPQPTPVTNPIPIPLTMPVDNDQPLMILPEELTQHNIELYNQYTTYSSQYGVGPAVEVVQPPLPEEQYQQIIIQEEEQQKILEQQKKNEELEDLAMLGIDANDLAAQCI